MKEDKIGGACGTRGRKGNACRVLVGKTAEGENLEDLGVDDNIILKWIGGQRHMITWKNNASLIRQHEACRDCTFGHMSLGLATSSFSA